ncbi:hypothetical protein K431DRAFT_289728 [Polychaeton citri CBS 116435]|uniref:Autophagy-related protein 17 n=1 Tax=Polychaeton citri CBS 116435 TaxID=1314669 RepID=A0A9P4PYB0_9PEZI|nr:hypothetical protein K431DRAFT_289728 [Polychaeton citri CBS 116435]
MSSSDESSPSPSPSPPASPRRDVNVYGPLSLERLIEHFLAAKRSLTATTSVSRANDLVTGSRHLIKETAVLCARNSFARRGIHEQLSTLHAIKSNVSHPGNQAGDEFDDVIKSLDRANDTLQVTLRELKDTIVHTSLHQAGLAAHRESTSPARSSADHGASDKDKVLYDFVNEAQHEELLSDLRGLIDSFNDARGSLEDSVTAFDGMIRPIEETLHESAQADSLREKRTIYDSEPAPRVPALFKAIEEHALALAQLLHSLLGHYDLCINALKHTEGGGEAAKAAVEDAPGLSKSSQNVEESLYKRKVADDIGEHELLDMLAVVDHDAAEVDDVVLEIKDRAAELEGQYEQISRHASDARSTNAIMLRALEQLHQIQVSLPSFISASSAFLGTWSGIKVEMQEKTQALADLTDFYINFQGSYDKLLREVERRERVDAQSRRLAEKAQKELDKLYTADSKAREHFMDTVGEFLPRDLWPSLADEGTRWEVTEVASHDSMNNEGNQAYTDV